MPVLEKLIDRLWQTEIGKNLIQAEADETERDRAAAIKALADLDKATTAERPKLLAARDAADRKRTQALEAVKTAQAEFNSAWVDVLALSAREDQKRSQLHATLEATAPPEIDTFVERLTAEAERLRKEPADQRDTGRRDGFTRMPIVETNRPLIGARLTAIPRAIDEARSLMLENIEPERLARKLDAIWNSLPDTTLPGSAN